MEDEDICRVIAEIDEWIGWKDRICGSIYDRDAVRCFVCGKPGIADEKVFLTIPDRKALKMYRNGTLREYIETELAIWKMKQ